MVRAGLDQVSKLWPKSLNGARVGLLVHPASVDRNIVHTVDVMMKIKKLTVTALFGPQHGIRGETQDNMIEWKGFRESRTGLPVYSLYGKTRKPEPDMLHDTDVLVIDLQDAGARYYTFIWTMDLCMQACEETGKSIVVLDRPNPLGGRRTEGPVLETAFASFVGLRPLTVRHGMTIGEIGNYLKNEYYPGLDFHVIPLQGWKRTMWFDHTGLPWIMPSPNMPTPETALVYPGMCLLEGTNLSEGRGTTRPFEIFGAPFIDPFRLRHHLRHSDLPGVIFRPLHFQPVFQKHAGKLCGGAQIHVTDKNTFRPFKTGVAILKAVHDLYPEHFVWKRPPYEYETKKMPVDILAGTDRLRKDIERGQKLDRMEAGWQEECREFDRTVRKRFLLYQ
ncbi:MAG: exo-beta-N-acetylmuramidase NamZ family protein [Nitrospirota bacterium]